MLLIDLPLIFALTGLALYTVLAGADFGAGMWQLTAGDGPDAQRIRDILAIEGDRRDAGFPQQGEILRRAGRA